MQICSKQKTEIELYVHIPFCVKKCDYCDFLSAPTAEEVRKAYIEVIKKEVAMRSCKEGLIVTSVFFGGGTPTVLSGDELADILHCLMSAFDFAEKAEISLECNPGTADYEKLKKCREAGFNRLSIGLQSALDEELKSIGRIHSFKDFINVYEAANRAGFNNINVDIITALPGQTMEDVDRTLERVLLLDPPPKHISAYSLILEEGTAFWKRYEENKLQLPDEDAERSMHWHVFDVLEAGGYKHYEISNLSKPGYECRHNIGYWVGRPYLGFGIGAASYTGNVRFSNIRNITEYINVIDKSRLNGSSDNICNSPDVKTVSSFGRNYIIPPTAEDITELDIEERMAEFMFLGLRMTCGVSETEFKNRYDISIDEKYGKIIENNVKQGLLCRGNGYIYLTRQGEDLANYVMAQFV